MTIPRETFVPDNMKPAKELHSSLASSNQQLGGGLPQAQASRAVSCACLDTWALSGPAHHPPVAPSPEPVPLSSTLSLGM